MQTKKLKLVDMDKKLGEAFDVLSEQAKDLFLDENVSQRFTIPTSLEFMRDYVAKNRPLLIRRAVSHWPACSKWNPNFFRNNYGKKLVSVTVTPNGYADGISVKMPEEKEYFVLPFEEMLTFGQFLDNLESRDKKIYYIQRQNSNFTEDFPELLKDIDQSTLQFAEKAFNKSPDAINFWMGDERAVTSLHKDPYENIYCVISGFKDLILIPPTDYPNVSRSKYPVGQWRIGEDGTFFIEPKQNNNDEEEMIEWVSVDPMNPDLKKHPAFKRAKAFEIRVNEGDILYLPSLWYHHVRQSQGCIAINNWYDMDYDARYCYYKMVEKLCE